MSEKLQAGVQEILRDLFQQGSLTGLQVAGSPAEYYVRVGIQLGEKMFKHSLSGGGHSAISSCSQACDNLCQGGATFLKDGAIKITESFNMLVIYHPEESWHAEKKGLCTRPDKNQAVEVFVRSDSSVTQALFQLRVEVGTFWTRPQRTLAHPGPLVL